MRDLRRRVANHRKPGTGKKKNGSELKAGAQPGPRREDPLRPSVASSLRSRRRRAPVAGTT